MRATSWTRTTRGAALDPERHGGRSAVNRARSGTGMPRTVPMNFFLDVPSTTGLPRPRNSSSRFRSARLCVEILAETDARVDHDLFPVHAGLNGDLDAFFEILPDLIRPHRS